MDSNTWAMLSMLLRAFSPSWMYDIIWLAEFCASMTANCARAGRPWSSSVRAAAMSVILCLIDSCLLMFVPIGDEPSGRLPVSHLGP